MYIKVLRGLICTGTTSENQGRSTPETKPRWNPKPEQLQILESLFNSGMVSPSRDEIKRIRSQLEEFGQVGDANVFYWLQNKKARSKQRQRHLHAESSKSSLENTGTNQSTEIINGANVTTNSLPSIVPATAFSTHQENYHVQTNGQMSNAQGSYMHAVAAAAAGGEIFNQLSTCTDTIRKIFSSLNLTCLWLYRHSFKSLFYETFRPQKSLRLV